MPKVYIATVTDANDAIKRARDGQRNVVLVRVMSGGAIRLVPIKMAS